MAGRAEGSRSGWALRIHAQALSNPQAPLHNKAQFLLPQELGDPHLALPRSGLSLHLSFRGAAAADKAVGTRQCSNPFQPVG